MRFLRSFLCLSALLWSGGHALAAPGDSIGSAVSIVNVVMAHFAADERQLTTGDDVRQEELIEVASDGRGELRLRDETKLALGPGARLLLDEFVYRPDVSGGAIVLKLVKGAFRFITGVAAKPAYVIRTPTASITVRGTIFDIYVQDNGLTWLLLIEGAINVCNEVGKCRLHDEPGKLIQVTAAGDLGDPVKWTSLPQKQDVKFDSAFPFIVKAPSLDPSPVFTRDDIVGDEQEAKIDDSDEGERATKPKRKKKATVKPTKRKKKAKVKRKSRKKKASKKRRRRTKKASSNDAKRLLQGLAIGITVGKSFGGGKKRRSPPRRERGGYR